MLFWKRLKEKVAKDKWLSGEIEKNSWVHSIFRAIKPICMIKRWLYFITHLLDPLECEAPGLNHNVSCA